MGKQYAELVSRDERRHESTRGVYVVDGQSFRCAAITGELS